MDNVVDLKPSSGNRRTRRTGRSRTALVLGGGGVTGGVYEIGALRALDLLSVNRTVNEFDVFVGTSAGSFVASLAANGITPEEMMRVVDNQVPAPFGDVSMGSLLRPNFGDFARKGIGLPLQTIRAIRHIVGDLGQVSALDLVLSLAEGLPSGMYTGVGIEKYLRSVLSDDNRSNDFRELGRELYIAATDLDTCERVVFGSGEWRDIPISQAVSASIALPMVYKPVEIRGREFIDGGIMSTTNLDIAVEAGAKLIIVVNPLVPYVNDFSRSQKTLRGSRPRRVSDMGFPHIGYQTFKLLAHQRLHEMARQWEQRYPGVDILLIEPEPNDALMFETSIMNYARRVDIARHGFQSVTLKLARDYDKFAEITKRHGIEISPTRVRKVVRHFASEAEPTRAWRKILEQTTGSLLRQSAAD